MAQETTPILNIASLIERPRIAIDGQSYEIVSPEELPLLTSQRVAALGRKLDRLMKADELVATGERDLSVTLNTIADVIMAPVPDDVRARLSEAHLLSVIEVFTMLSLARKARLAGAAVQGMTGAKPKTAGAGAKPSPGSSVSTAATPAAG